MNRHRSHWSAMGSPRSAVSIFAGIELRNAWHAKVIQMWKEKNIGYDEAMSRPMINEARALMVGKFYWTMQGLEELYLANMVD